MLMHYLKILINKNYILTEKPEQKFDNLKDLVINYCKNELE